MSTEKISGLERTMLFLNGEKVDHPPFHPIIMRWAAKYSGVKYRNFCTIPEAKTEANKKCAEDIGLDWVTVMSDPWAEASAFGLSIDYPEDSLPIDTGGHFPDALSASALRKYDPLKNSRCLNRIEEIKLYKKNCSDKFIVGWVEGPVAEYVDLRRASNASLDLLMEPEAVQKAIDIIVESAIGFIEVQVKAGAHCIGIGDAFCSQIGPELYYQYAFDKQKLLVDCVHSLGAIAKLHICGDTSSILKGMIDTGADIIDIDHLVKDISSFTPLLGSKQVFCGKSDPVSVIQNGDGDMIRNSVIDDFMNSGRRCIVSAGCEITPGTSVEQMRIFRKAADILL
jgi:MtaA/CmuA family methyltransferase